MQVHKETIDKIPNALPNRNNVDIEIYGMEGIPENDLRQHEKNKGTAEMVYPETSTSKVVVPPKPAPPVPPPTGMMPLGYLPNPTVAPYMGGIMPVPPMPYPITSNSQFPPMPPPIPGVFPGAPVTAPLPPTPASTLLGQNNVVSSLTSTPSTTISAAVSKPLFPSVASSSNSLPSSQPVPVTISSSSHGTIVTTTANTRIIHPEDDLSLEELRARLPRYKHLNLETCPKLQPVNGGNQAAPVIYTNVQPNVPNPLITSQIPSNIYPPAPPPPLFMPQPQTAAQYQQTFRPAF